MTLSQQYEKTMPDYPESPGTLMVEPSAIPTYRFDCEIVEDFKFFNKGEKIKADVLPVELENKLVLHTGKGGDRTEIKLSHIKHIETFEGERGFLDTNRLFVKVILQNDPDLILDFDDHKIDEFISLVNDFSHLGNTFWDFLEVDFNSEDNFGPTKIYHKTPFLARGEELLWSFVGTEGVFGKKAKFVMALTNFRAIIYYFDNHECECVLLSVPDDILVMNSRKVSQSSKGGQSMGERYGMRVGPSETVEKDAIQTIGDVVFMKDGEKMITFGQMTDPHGLAHLAKSIKKNSTIRDKPAAEIPANSDKAIRDKPAAEIPADDHKAIRDKQIITNPTPPSDYIDELSTYLGNSDWAKVEKLADFILEKTPDDFIALRAKLGAYQGEQKWRRVVEVSEQILSLDPQNFDARTELPGAYLHLQEIEKAEDALKESLDMYSDAPQLLSAKRRIDDFRKSNFSATFKHCNNCSNRNRANSKFCNKCGLKLEKNCVRCSHVNSESASFCNRCGFSLKLVIKP